MLEWVQQTDVAMLLWIQEFLRWEIWTPFWKGITLLGNGGWFWIALGLFFLIPGKTRKVGITVLLALVIGALITNVVLKNAVARMRPYDYTGQILLLIEKQLDYSFPSGHSCASFAAACVCVKKLPKKYGIPCMILAVLIAFSRLYVGVHYPTDVLGGIVIGLCSGWMAVFAMDRWKGRASEE